MINPFPITYADLLNTLLDSRIIQKNERTGHKIATLAGGHSFKIDLSNNLLPVSGNRRLHPKTAAAEVAWFISGEQDISFMRKYAPIWDKFTEDDGSTIDAAYGYRWRRHFGRDQLIEAVEALKLNPSDRRIYISAWNPGFDGLMTQGQKNVPCPTSFTLSIIDNQLHSSLMIRSSDVFVGLPYDVMGHAILMEILRSSIAEDPQLEDLNLGTLHVTLAHPHLYEIHRDMAEQSLAHRKIDEFPNLIKNWTLANVEKHMDTFVDLYAISGRNIEWPEFNPRPEVVL